MVPRSGLQLSLMMGIFFALAFSCGPDKDEASQPKQTAQADPEAGSSLSFASDIKPLMERSCSVSGCHDSRSAESGFNYETWEGAKRGMSAGIRSIEAGRMPPSGYQAITGEELNRLASWNSGGQNQ